MTTASTLIVFALAAAAVLEVVAYLVIKDDHSRGARRAQPE
ncbi:hypothetical protein [Noviherbaspirillum sp.]|nr:hypothetical protein [Noviherbaspirillum sp.]HZW23008.1 hypothetical protein [Noviherbaspirillum sp.]